jgi:ketosteroid isomerase-like protein
MSQENLELVTRAINASFVKPKPDTATMNELYHPEHVWVPVDVATTEVVGGAGYKAWLDEQGELMPWEGELHGAIDIEPDTVLAVSTIRWHGAASGIDLEQRVWNVMTVSDGQITRTEAFLSSADALKALGRSE